MADRCICSILPPFRIMHIKLVDISTDDTAVNLWTGWQGQSPVSADKVRYNNTTTYWSPECSHGTGLYYSSHQTCTNTFSLYCCCCRHCLYSSITQSDHSVSNSVRHFARPWKIKFWFRQSHMLIQQNLKLEPVAFAISHKVFIF